MGGYQSAEARHQSDATLAQRRQLLLCFLVHICLRFAALSCETLPDLLFDLVDGHVESLQQPVAQQQHLLLCERVFAGRLEGHSQGGHLTVDQKLIPVRRTLFLDVVENPLDGLPLIRPHFLQQQRRLLLPRRRSTVCHLPQRLEVGLKDVLTLPHDLVKGQGHDVAQMLEDLCQHLVWDAVTEPIQHQGQQIGTPGDLFDLVHAQTHNLSRLVRTAAPRLCLLPLLLLFFLTVHVVALDRLRPCVQRGHHPRPERTQIRQQRIAERRNHVPQHRNDGVGDGAVCGEVCLGEVVQHTHRICVEPSKSCLGAQPCDGFDDLSFELLPLG
mmetsp:Transcript_15480/g.44232  ORF Transcript_15480/g.44232 Transcript_15480/m.44232 type:complete len:328 (+) Transcript_15480:960-1943(+)